MKLSSGVRVRIVEIDDVAPDEIGNDEGPPLLPLPVLAEVLKVLTKVRGRDTHVETDFSVERELLRVGQSVDAARVE